MHIIIYICLFWGFMTQSTLERRCGRVDSCGAEGRRSKSHSGQKTGKLSLSDQQRTGNWLTSGKV